VKVFDGDMMRKQNRRSDCSASIFIVEVRRLTVWWAIVLSSCEFTMHGTI
jgi:phosphatidylglycerophosphate synthase